MWTCGVPVSVVRAVRDAGSARQSGPLRICILVLGCRRSSISTHVSSVSHVSQSSSWHSSVSHVSQSSRGTWSSRCMQRRRHTLRTTPTTDTPRTTGGYRARSGIAPQTTRRTDGGGGRIPHTPEQHRHLTRQRSLDVAGALPSVLSRHFNGGVRPRAAPSRSRRETSEPHAMRACAMAPLAPCLRQID